MNSNGWQSWTLAELIAVKHGYAFKSQFFGDSGDYIVLTPGNFHEWGGLKAKGEKEKLYEADPPEEFILKRGDLLVAMTDLTQKAPILGSPAFISEAGKYLHNQRLGKVMINRPDVVTKEFLFWLFNSYSVRGQIKGSATGSTVRHTSPSRIGEVCVEIPSLCTQRKIASLLSAYDDLIENNTRRIALLEEMAQAIYREWFVHFRYPGHENVPLVDSSIGEIPEGWEPSPMTELSVNGKKGIIGGPFGSNLGTKDYVDEGVPVIRGANLSESGRFSSDGFVFVSEEKAATLAANQVGRGDIIVTQRGTLGQVGMVPLKGPYNKYIISQSQMSITADPKRCLPLYLLHFLRSPEVVARIKNHAMSSGVPHINLTMLREFKVMVPPLKLQHRYQESVQAIADAIESFDEQSVNLRTTRDLLLPKLISGKLDVSDLDIETLMPGDVDPENGNAGRTDEPATVFVPQASVSRITAPPRKNGQPTPISEIETQRVMAEFRQEARRLGTVTRAELLKAVSVGLGYQRLGSQIEETLKGHLRAGIRRRIIGTAGEDVWLETPTMADYERDELIDSFRSVMRKGQEYEREEVIRSLANHFGFRRLRETVREPIKSVINGAIRRGVLGYEGNLIWRED